LKWSEDYSLDVIDAHSFLVVTLFKHRKLGKPKPVAHGKGINKEKRKEKKRKERNK